MFKFNGRERKYGAKHKNHPVPQSRQHYMKVLHNSFYLNGHTLEFNPQT